MYSIVEIDLKKASKVFAQHFSCGSSVTGDDEVVVQGDVTDNIFNLIQKHWPDVSGYCNIHLVQNVTHCELASVPCRRQKYMVNFYVPCSRKLGLDKTLMGN